MFDLLADDAEWTIVGNSPVSRTFTSRAEFMDIVIDPFNNRMSTPLVPEVHALYAEGDTVIAYFDARATAKDGKPYFNSYTRYLTLEHGQVVKAIAFLTPPSSLTSGIECPPTLEASPMAEFHSPPVSGVQLPHHLRMFTARDTTTATVTKEAKDWSIIKSFAQVVRGIVSVGLKAVALVNDV